MRKKRKWSELSGPERVVAVVVGTIQVSLAVAAWIDLARRPSLEVRGRKRLWALVLPINIVGPLAYFRWGRLEAPAMVESDIEPDVVAA